MGCTDDRESVSVRAHSADIKKAPCAVHKMNLGRNAVALARINCEEWQHVTHLRLPSTEEEAQEEAEKVLNGNLSAILAAESEQVFSRRV